MAGRPPQLSEIQHRQRRQEAVRHHDAARANAQRGSDLRGSRNAVERVARNLDITVTKTDRYRGEATFHGGTIKIQNYLPMSASMKAVFRVDNGIVHFERMNLTTDGAESVITGDADMTRWPEQTYQVKSVVDFKRMRELFFAKETLHAVGRRALQRRVSSLQRRPIADGTIRKRRGRPQHRRPRLSLSRLTGQPLVAAGSVRRHRHHDRLLWRHGEAEVFDRAASGARSLRGRRSTPNGRTSISPPTATSCRWRACGSRGRWSGRNLLDWPLGRFRERRGRRLLGSDSAGRRASAVGRTARAVCRAAPSRGSSHPPIGHLPIAGTGDVSLRPRLDRVLRWPILHARDRRHVQRPNGLGRQLPNSVPRDERRPAGERSRAGRNDDRLRCANQSDYGRRHRRVLRRHDRVAWAAARRRHVRRRRACARST